MDRRITCRRGLDRRLGRRQVFREAVVNAERHAFGRSRLISRQAMDVALDHGAPLVDRRRAGEGGRERPVDCLVAPARDSRRVIARPALFVAEGRFPLRAGLGL
ncbi:hypothetical protein D3C72_735200 [compost metagenome]